MTFSEINVQFCDFFAIRFWLFITKKIHFRDIFTLVCDFSSKNFTFLWLFSLCVDFLSHIFTCCDFLYQKLSCWWLFYTIFWLCITYILRPFFTSLWVFITNTGRVFNCWFYIFVLNFLIKFFWNFYLNVLFYVSWLVNYDPVRESSYLPLPIELKAKHACLNSQNNDKKCFLWSIQVSLHPVQHNAYRVSKYQEYEHEFKWLYILHGMHKCSFFK